MATTTRSESRAWEPDPPERDVDAPGRARRHPDSLRRPTLTRQRWLPSPRRGRARRRTPRRSRAATPVDRADALTRRRRAITSAPLATTRPNRDSPAAA